MSAYRLLADLVLVLHLGFIAFAVGGGLLVLRWRRLAWLHLPAVAWGVWVELTGGVCPLTPLESALRRAGGGTGYAGGFVEHLLAPLVYPAGLSPGDQVLLGVGLLVVNVGVYAGVRARVVRARNGR